MVERKGCEICLRLRFGNSPELVTSELVTHGMEHFISWRKEGRQLQAESLRRQERDRVDVGWVETGMHRQTERRSGRCRETGWVVKKLAGSSRTEGRPACLGWALSLPCLESPTLAGSLEKAGPGARPGSQRRPGLRPRFSHYTVPLSWPQFTAPL